MAVWPRITFKDDCVKDLMKYFANFSIATCERQLVVSLTFLDIELGTVLGWILLFNQILANHFYHTA